MLKTIQYSIFLLRSPHFRFSWLVFQVLIVVCVLIVALLITAGIAGLSCFLLSSVLSSTFLHLPFLDYFRVQVMKEERRLAAMQGDNPLLPH